MKTLAAIVRAYLLHRPKNASDIDIDERAAVIFRKISLPGKFSFLQSFSGYLAALGLASTSKITIKKNGWIQRT